MPAGEKGQSPLLPGQHEWSMQGLPLPRESRCLLALSRFTLSLLPFSFQDAGQQQDCPGRPRDVCRAEVAVFPVSRGRGSSPAGFGETLLRGCLPGTFCTPSSGSFWPFGGKSRMLWLPHPPQGMRGNGTREMSVSIPFPGAGRGNQQALLVLLLLCAISCSQHALIKTSINCFCLGQGQAGP